MAEFVPDMLTFQEFVMQEPLLLATIQQAVLEFLRDRDDVAVFGAQAVNAYVAEPRMTQNIDLLAIGGALFAEELRQHLAQRFHIAMQTRQVAEGRGLRLFQVRKSGNRHLVDIRSIERLPDTQRIGGVLVLALLTRLQARSLPIISGVANRNPARIGATLPCCCSHFLY